jgi:hypothetical protein
MSETTWTPGPWHFGKMNGYGDNLCVTRRPTNEYGPQGTIGDCPIAQVYAKAPHWENSFPYEANARLIAAAPELAEALDNIMMALDLPGDHCELANAKRQAAAALAKARGETP